VAKDGHCDLDRGESKGISEHKKGRVSKIWLGGLFLPAIFFLQIGVVGSQAKPPQIVFASESYDFGRIKRLGGKVSYNVTVSNEGNTPLTLTYVKLS
jgi:hypothetical protein